MMCILCKHKLFTDKTEGMKAEACDKPEGHDSAGAVAPAR